MWNLHSSVHRVNLDKFGSREETPWKFLLNYLKMIKRSEINTKSLGAKLRMTLNTAKIQHKIVKESKNLLFGG